MRGRVSECVLWEGRLNANGYGLVGRRLAHRVLWEQDRGPIPDGLILHHVCRTAACVNLDHLRCITHAEHNQLHLNAWAWYERQRAKTHCARGHEYTEATTGYDKQGKRYCKECSREDSAAYHKRNRDRLLPQMRERSRRLRERGA